MSEGRRFTEKDFNSIVAACQWSSSFFVAAAFLSILLGLNPPKELAQAFIWMVSTTSPLFLTVGMFQVWKLPDNRKWWAVGASAFLVLAGILLLAHVAQNNRFDEYQKTLASVRESVAWTTAKAEYDAVLADYNQLAGRTFTQEYATQFDKNQKAKDARWAKVEEKANALKMIEPKPVKNTGGMFDLFGEQWAPLVFAIFLGLYAVVNEGTALSLSYRSKAVATPARGGRTGEPKMSENLPMPPNVVSLTQGKPTAEKFGVDEYIAVASRLGRNGKLAGSLAVSKETGQSEWTCKMLLREAVDSGRVRVSNGTSHPAERERKEQ